MKLFNLTKVSSFYPESFKENLILQAAPFRVGMKSLENSFFFEFHTTDKPIKKN